MDDQDKFRLKADALAVARVVAAVAAVGGLILGFSFLVVTLLT